MDDNRKSENKYRYLIKNTGILTISSFSSRILVFLLVPLYTSVLSTAEYGTYDLAVTTIQLLIPVFTLNIYDAVMRFFMDNEYSKKEVSAVGIKHILISSVLFAATTILNYKIGIIGSVRDYSLLVFLYYLSNLLNQYLTQAAKGTEQVKDIAVAGVINTSVTLLLNIALLLIFRMGLKGFFIAYIAGQTSSALILYFRLQYWTLLKLRINRQYEKEMLAYSVPLVVGTLGWWCNNASDRYIVTFLCGIAANGVYSVAYKIPSILTTIQQIFLQAWQISAVKEYDDQDSAAFYGKTFVAINIGMCLICMVLILFTKPIAHVLYARDFYAAWQYVPFLLVSGVFNAAAGIIGPILNANKNSKSLGTSSLIGAAVKIILNIMLIKLIGVQGAAIATAFSSYIIYLLRRIAAGKNIEITGLCKVYCSWVLIIAQAVICIYIGSVAAEIGLITVFIIINRAEISSIAKKMVNMRKH